MQRRTSLIRNFISFVLYTSIITFSYSQNVMIKGIVRNPANKPTKQEELILKSFEEKLLAGANFNDLVFKQTTTNYKEKTIIQIKQMLSNLRVNSFYAVLLHV